MTARTNKMTMTKLEYELHPFQKKMMEDLQRMSKDVVLIWPKHMGKAFVQKPVARDIVRTNAYYSMYGRQHKKKRWMSDTYHNRIQKKWDKRYGKGVMNAKQPVVDSIRERLLTQAENRVMRQGYDSSLMELTEFQSKNRLLQTYVQPFVVLHPQNECEGTGPTFRVLKERPVDGPFSFSVKDFNIKDLEKKLGLK